MYNIKVLLSNMRFCYISCQVKMLGPKWVMRPLHCTFLFHLCLSGVHVNVIHCYFFFEISSEYTNNMSHSYSFGLEEFTTVHEE